MKDVFLALAQSFKVVIVIMLIAAIFMSVVYGITFTIIYFFATPGFETFLICHTMCFIICAVAWAEYTSKKYKKRKNDGKS